PELGQPPNEAIAQIGREHARYAALANVVVGQAMPPDIRLWLTETLPQLVREKVSQIQSTEVRSRVTRLLSTFEALDLHILDRPDAAQTPVRKVPDNGRLRPKVERLTVRVIGGEEDEARQFAERLVATLRRQTYLARAGT